MKKHEARKHLLGILKQKMQDEDDMGLKGKLPQPAAMQKVDVMADSPEGLEAGLSKAQELLQKRKAMLGIPDQEDDNQDDSEDMDNDEDQDPEAMEDAAIALLQKAQAQEKDEDDEENDEDDEQDENQSATKPCIEILKDMIDDAAMKMLKPLDAYLGIADKQDAQEVRDYYSKVSRLHA